MFKLVTLEDTCLVASFVYEFVCLIPLGPAGTPQPPEATNSTS